MIPIKTETIRLIRELRGYSQEYIAKKLGVTQQAYSHGEKNPDTLTLKRLRELSKIFDVPLTSLIGEENMYVQQNYSQHGGQAATHMVVNGLAQDEKELFNQIIAEQKSTITLLSDLLKSKL